MHTQLGKYTMYPPDCNVIFDAVYSSTGQALLISECQDIITALKAGGFIYKGEKSTRSEAMKNYWIKRHKQEKQFNRRYK